LLDLHLVLRVITDGLGTQCHVFDLHVASWIVVLLVDLLLAQGLVDHGPFLIQLTICYVLTIIIKRGKHRIVTYI